jgi:GTPase Era involved in 16S rRNA processing
MADWCSAGEARRSEQGRRVAAPGRPVYLDITVKVMPKWRTSEKVLEEYGY